MIDAQLSEVVAQTAQKFQIPGVAAAVLVDGQEIHAAHGVTSSENPLPITQDTLFMIGSVSKTFAATALMRLVDQGEVDLEAPVRRYVPEFRLKDEETAATVTVLNLVNHTSGLSWGVFFESGLGDDALARYVEQLTEVELIARPGERTSYSQGAFNLLGRVIEKVTGQTFERAVASLVFEPLGLSHSFYSGEEMMSRRFSAGHERAEDGSLYVTRKWRMGRGDSPGGGLASSASDLMRWARFHLGDGRSESGERILPAELLQRMRKPTAVLRGSNMGHAVGICWFLRDIDGLAAFGHGGSSVGQFAELLIVPDRHFAVVSLSNANPEGIPCNQAIVRWALQQYAGLIDRDPEPLPYDEARAREIVGTYENDVMDLTIDDKNGTGLRLEVLLKPEIRAADAKGEMPQDHEPFDFGLLPGDGDEYIIVSGAFRGQRGFFSRDEMGAVVGVDLAGRLFGRVGVEVSA